MHKGPKYLQTLWDHQEKIPFVENFKECAIFAIVREKTPFSGIPQGLKKVSHVLRCAKKCSPEAKKNAKLSGLSEKNVYSVESLRFCR